MTVCLLIIGTMVGANVGLAYWLRQEERRWKRAYDYAVARADFTEAGRAYSDMATVLVLADEPLEER